MIIKVFGPGCAKCAETENVVKAVAAAKGGQITVQKISDFKEMMAVGVMSTPAVAVDDIMKSAGRVPGREEVAAWIDSAARAPSCGCGSA